MHTHEQGTGKDRARIGAKLVVKDDAHISKRWTIRKYANRADRLAGIESEPALIIDGNVLLNEGITELLKLAGGITADAFSNANAYVGVGDSATAAAAAQTGLQAATNKYYQAVAATYPQVSAQTITWQAVFAAANGNFVWNEITVANGNSDAADNLNRLVQALGTKASPAEWTVDLDITIS